MTDFRMQPRPRRSQEDRKRASRDALLAGLTRVVARHGLEGATLPRVASAAGLSTGAIQHHYGQLEPMLEPMIARCAGRVVPRLQSVWDETKAPAERVRVAVRAMLALRCADDDDMAAWLQLVAASGRDAQVRGWMRPHLDQVRESVARGLVTVAEGLGMRLRTTPTQSARAVIAWVEGAALHVRSEPGDLDAQCECLEHAVRSVIAF